MQTLTNGRKLVCITNYIFVTGSAESHYGEGVVSAALASALATRGVDVVAVKIDHYLNLDAGSLDCNVYGECYVTADGCEVDRCLGIYERMTGVKASQRHHITAGRILQKVINDERRGSFFGTAVSTSEHVVDEYKQRILSIGESENRQCVVVEVGGNVRSIDSAAAIAAVKAICDDMPERCICVACACHVEQYLRETGIEPLITLAQEPCEGAMCLPYDGCIYSLPHLMEQSGLLNKVLGKMGIRAARGSSAWLPLVKVMKEADDEIKVALVGKYDDARHSYLSLCEALRINAAHCGKRLVLNYLPSTSFYGSGNSIDDALSEADAVVVATGDGAFGTEGYISALQWCREHNKVTLGIGLGMQCMAIEFARNVLGMQDATSAEISARSAHCVVAECDEQKRMAFMPELKRLGDYPTLVLDFDSKARRAYGNALITERHRHRYEFDAKKYGEEFAQAGMTITGINPQSQLPDIIEIDALRWYVGVSDMPECGLRASDPHPLLKSFIFEAAKHDR